MNLSKIKDIAKDQGKTLGSVAAAVGITHAGLNTLMKENSTRVDTLLKIANYLGVSITEFLDEDDMRVPAPAYGNSATMGSRITAVYIDFDRKKVDKANRKLIDLIKQRAAGDEHNTDGPHSGAV